MTRREGAILRLLEQAIIEIQMELTAAGYDEVLGNPILKGKQQFVDRASKQIRKWKADV